MGWIKDLKRKISIRNIKKGLSLKNIGTVGAGVATGGLSYTSAAIGIGGSVFGKNATEKPSQIWEENWGGQLEAQYRAQSSIVRVRNTLLANMSGVQKGKMFDSLMQANPHLKGQSGNSIFAMMDVEQQIKLIKAWGTSMTGGYPTQTIRTGSLDPDPLIESSLPDARIKEGFGENVTSEQGFMIGMGAAAILFLILWRLG